MVEEDIRGLCRLPLKSNRKPLTARSWWRRVGIGISSLATMVTVSIQVDRHWSAVLAVATIPFHAVKDDDALNKRDTCVATIS